MARSANRGALIVPSHHKRKAAPPDLTRFRLRELERLIQHRHGFVPDTDDASLYLVPVAQSLLRVHETKNGHGSATLESILGQLRVWKFPFAPDVAECQLEDAAREALRFPRTANADAIARQLHVSYAERQQLGLTTIGAYDCDKSERMRRRAERKRHRDRLRAAAKRAKRGAQPRADYIAHSASATRPWEGQNISRATFYRRQRQAAE